MKIIELEETDSTNDYCKQLKDDCNVAVVAKLQKRGKGTKGRSFVSDDGGLYISFLRRFENFPAENAFEIMINYCVAVCKTLESFGVKPQIRWANDVLVNGKKICGTLIENTFKDNCITRSIVGIGINVNNVLPEELKDIATTLCEQTEKNIATEEVRDRLIKFAEESYSVEDYKSYIDYFGREVILKTPQGETRAIALDVEPDGRLAVIDGNGVLKKISSAEVGLRL